MSLYTNAVNPIMFQAGAVCLVLLVVGHITAWETAPELAEIVLLGMDILFNAIATSELPVLFPSTH